MTGALMAQSNLKLARGDRAIIATEEEKQEKGIGGKMLLKQESTAGRG